MFSAIRAGRGTNGQFAFERIIANILWRRSSTSGTVKSTSSSRYAPTTAISTSSVIAHLHPKENGSWFPSGRTGRRNRGAMGLEPGRSCRALSRLRPGPDRSCFLLGRTGWRRLAVEPPPGLHQFCLRSRSSEDLSFSAGKF